MENGIYLKCVRDCPEMINRAAVWFSGKWEVPAEAYAESMRECAGQKTGVPQWYLVFNQKGEIVAGAGVIENDFHDRKDLVPNLCALYVEKEYRRKGVAREILNFARRDMGNFGFTRLYLVTDHTEFYEKCGWKFLTMVNGDGDITERMYVAPCI